MQLCDLNHVSNITWIKVDLHRLLHRKHSFGAEQKSNIIVTRVKIMITFCIVQNVIQIYNLVKRFNVLTDFGQKFSLLFAFWLITKPYHYFDSCYNKINLLFDPKWGYASCVYY